MSLISLRLNLSRLWLKKILSYLVITVISNLIWSCDAIDPCQELEILRKTSQDKLVDFVVVEKNCGATTSVSTFIFIVPKGSPVDEFDSVFDADHIEGLEVKWVAPKQIAITYKKARIFKYTNFWNSRHVKNFNHEISILEFSK